MSTVISLIVVVSQSLFWCSDYDYLKTFHYTPFSFQLSLFCSLPFLTCLLNTDDFFWYPICFSVPQYSFTCYGKYISFPTPRATWFICLMRGPFLSFWLYVYSACYFFLHIRLPCALYGPLCPDFAFAPNTAYFFSFPVLVSLPSTETLRTGCCSLFLSFSVDLTWGWRKGSKLQGMNWCIGQNSGGSSFSVSSQIQVNDLSIHCIHSLTSPPLLGASASSPNSAQWWTEQPVLTAVPISTDLAQSFPFRLEISKSSQDSLGLHFFLLEKSWELCCAKHEFITSFSYCEVSKLGSTIN